MKQATLSLTEGPITSPLLRLAFPLFLGGLFQQFYNTIDALIVAHYIGENAFAALGLAGSIMNLFLFVLVGSCTGYVVIAARLYGKQDLPALHREIFTGGILGILFTCLISAAGLISLPCLFHLIGAPSALIPYGTSYLKIILLGLLAPFFYNFLAATLRAIGNTRMALVFLSVSLLSNILFAYLTVAKFHMGVQGAALSTVWAQLLSAILCLIYIRVKLPHLIPHRKDFCFDWELIRLTLRYSSISALHQSTLYIGKFFVQGSVNLLGLSGVAAYAAATRVEGIAQAFGDSGGDALSVFIAQNRGAGKSKRSEEGFRKGLLLMLLFSLFLSAGLFLFSAPATRLFLPGAHSEALRMSASYLRTVACFYFLNFMGNAFVGYYRGTGKVNIPFFGTGIQISIRVVLSWLLVPHLGLMAVGLATGIGWAAIVCFQFFVYRYIHRSDPPEKKAA